MQIIVRHAEDDFHALQIAQGMEDAGAQVFSITNNGVVIRFLVFAKYDSTALTPDQIDACIEKRLSSAVDENTTLEALDD